MTCFKIGKLKLVYTISITLFLFVGWLNDDCINCHNEYGSDKYAICAEDIPNCESGDYCLFGYKWGIDNRFESNGQNAKGPQTPGGLVTNSFQEHAQTVNTHVK